MEVREKIFVDKPMSKQLEVTMEQMQQLNKSAKKNDKGPHRGSFDDEDMQVIEERKQSNTGYRQVDDFLYGAISGAELKEFKIQKMNRKGRFTNRILGIDGNNFYHKKVEKKQGFFGTLAPKSLFGSSAVKMKPMAGIQDYPRIDDYHFAIYFKQPHISEEVKVFRYRTENPD